MLARNAQVVILCGGFGTRIRDVADDIPKAMIPIGGRPILWHIMDQYARFGFRRFVLCLGYKGWTIKRFFLDYLLSNCDLTVNLQNPDDIAVHGPDIAENWEITLAETGLNTMTGCRVKRIEKYIEGDNFLLTYGDGLANINLSDLWYYHLWHGKTGTITSVPPPGRFGELTLDGDSVVEFCEKPHQSSGRISGGFMAFHRHIFDRLEDDPTLVFEQDPLMNLARDGELMTFRHEGFWRCMDNSRDFQYLNELWDAGNPLWTVLDNQRLRAAA